MRKFKIQLVDNNSTVPAIPNEIRFFIQCNFTFLFSGISDDDSEIGTYI